jgi:hypothetical protein
MEPGGQNQKQTVPPTVVFGLLDRFCLFMHVITILCENMLFTLKVHVLSANGTRTSTSLLYPSNSL